jgi:hypothetical protein
MPRTTEPDPINRLRRGLEIKAAHATGETWASVARRYGISESQARRSAKAAAEVIEVVGVFDQHDARALMARILAVQVTALDRLEGVFAGDPAESSVVNGVRAVSTLADSSWRLFARLGILPADGRKLALDDEARQVVEALVRVAADCGIDSSDLQRRLSQESSLTAIPGILEMAA